MLGTVHRRSKRQFLPYKSLQSKWALSINEEMLEQVKDLWLTLVSVLVTSRREVL